MEQKVL